MGFFGGNYEKAGSGIAKNAPKKKPFFRFWEMFFERFWKMVKLSLLTSLFCLPVITVGPAIAGMTKVLRAYILDKDTFMWDDFIKGFTKNFKKSFPVGIIDIIFALSLLSSLRVYPALAEQTGSVVPYVLCVISVGFALTVFMMNFFIFPMIVCTDLNFKNVIKNSFFLTALGLKTNIITLLSILLTAVIMTLLVFIMGTTAVLILVPVILVSFIGFLVMFNSYPQIQKSVIEPYYAARGQSNPEYDFLKPLDEDESVFVDKGGEEAPIEGKKKTKGKVIS